MSKNLTKSRPILLSGSTNPEDIVKAVNEHIVGSDRHLTIDISQMSLMDACRIAVLCSTEQYVKNPNGHIEWIVSSDSVDNLVSSMGLGNSSFIYK